MSYSGAKLCLGTGILHRSGGYYPPYTQGGIVMRKLYIITIIIILLLTGCGTQSITIETELAEGKIIPEVRLSEGELHFRYSSGNYPDFMLVDEAGRYGNPFIDKKGRALPYSADAGLLLKTLRLEPDSWAIPEGFKGTQYRDGHQVGFMVYRNIYTDYEIASGYLLSYEYAASENQSYIRIYTQYDKLPVGEDLYTYGEDNSRVGRMSFPVEFNINSSNQICFSTRFMKKSTGYEIKTGGVYQEDFIYLLLSILKS